MASSLTRKLLTRRLLIRRSASPLPSSSRLLESPTLPHPAASPSRFVRALDSPPVSRVFSSSSPSRLDETQGPAAIDYSLHGIASRQVTRRTEIPTLCIQWRSRDVNAGWARPASRRAPASSDGDTTSSDGGTRVPRSFDGVTTSSDGDTSILPEEEFHKLADETLHNLQEKFEEYGDEVQIDGVDIDYGNHVLTLKLGNLGTYVINKQTPNRQIWLSSPVSGPSRFDWDTTNKAWVYRRTNANLLKLLEEELTQLCGKPLSLSGFDSATHD